MEKQKQKSVSLSDEEFKEVGLLFELPEDEVIRRLTIFSKLQRAFHGLPLEETDIITRFTNVKEIMERSRFMTYPLCAKQEYLRLIHKSYGDVAVSCKEWADFEAKALISYKGLSREEYVKSVQRAMEQPQSIIVSQPQPQRVEQPKRRFWQRQPKPPKEFKHE